jgi:DNA-directed RNA polymerase specialized sigma24 family protein
MNEQLMEAVALVRRLVEKMEGRSTADGADVESAVNARLPELLSRLDPVRGGPRAYLRAVLETEFERQAMLRDQELGKIAAAIADWAELNASTVLWAAPAESALTSLGRRALERAVAGAVAQLPTLERQVVLLRFLNGPTGLAAVSAILGIGVDKVLALEERALDLLAAALREWRP